ncbi:MAG TPA: flagellar protein FlgN [Chromatiales bacterium]|nr:flagellar protein FlgN [Chromatiales bacterium]
MDTTTSFIHLIDREIACSLQLLEVLQEENAVLKEADTARLEELTVTKQDVLKELDTRVAAHNALLAELGLPPGREGTEKLLDFFVDDPHAEEKWNELQELAQAYRDLNEINGGIVALSQRHVRQALDILSGNGNVAGNTYNKGGETRSLADSQSIGKA